LQTLLSRTKQVKQIKRRKVLKSHLHSKTFYIQ